MGDFFVPQETLKENLGIQTVEGSTSQIQSLVNEVDDAAVEAEIAWDKAHFNFRNVEPEVHRRATRAGLAIRRRETSSQQP